MKQIYKVGNRVRVTNYSGIYNAYGSMARKMELGAWRSTHVFDLSKFKDHIGRIIAVDIHPKKQCVLLGIRLDNFEGEHRDIIAGTSTVEVMEPDLFEEELFTI